MVPSSHAWQSADHAGFDCGRLSPGHRSRYLRRLFFPLSENTLPAEMVACHLAQRTNSQSCEARPAELRRRGSRLSLAVPLFPDIMPLALA
jgi:hypothetical protein